MRNLYIIVCLVLVVTIFKCSAASLSRTGSKSDSKLKSFTERYALPTNIHTIAAKLPFTFGYRFTDDYGTMQSREEKTEPNGSKIGSYSFIDAKGIYRKVEYIADRHGFRATVTTNEPGTMAADPAHVRMLSENQDTTSLLKYGFGNSPQLEYSSNVFSKYNFSRLPDKNFFSDYKQDLDKIKLHPLIPKRPLLESGQDLLLDQKLSKTYKGSPITFSPQISDLIKNLEAPKSKKYSRPNSLESDIDLGDLANTDYNFNQKISQIGGYAKKVPTRYPRRHRDSRNRAKKRQNLKIHTPKGYENHSDLPLYMDK